MPITYPEGGMPGLTLMQKQQRQLMLPIDTFRVQLVPLRPAPKMKISNPEDVPKLVKEMGDYDREVAKLIHLDTKNQIMGMETISVGSLSASIVHPRESVKGAILNNSASVIFVHNHPSGICGPSDEDMGVTKSLMAAFKLVGIAFLDSIIVGKTCYFSFKEHGLLPAPILGAGIQEIAEPDSRVCVTSDTPEKVDFITAMTDYITAPDLESRKRVAEKIRTSRFYKDWADTFFYEHDAESAKKNLMKFLEAIEEAGGEVEVLKKKIADAERNHEFMVKVNVIVRKKIPDDQKIREIMALGKISETTVREILKPDYMGRVGFPQYALTNDLANIHRMKERLAELEKKAVTPTAEILFTGGHIVDNREADRVQIFFDQKPPQEMINKLRSEGWHWSPSIGAWQRKRTQAALYSASRVTGAVLPTVPAPVAPQKASLEDMVKEYKEIGEEMRRLGITRAGRPEADVLMSREYQLYDAIRDIYLEMLEHIPESSQIQPEGLGVLALAGRAATKAIEESPDRVNLREMVSIWLKGQDVIARIQAARSVEELQPIMQEISFLPIPEIDKHTLIGRYREKYNALMSERPFGAPVKAEEEKPRVLGAPTPQQRFEEEQRRKAAAKATAFRGQQKLTTGASVTKRLEEFGIKEKMLPELTASMREYIRGAQAVKEVIHYFRDGRPPIRGVAYRTRDRRYFVEANDGNIYDSMGWEEVGAQPSGVREATGYTQRFRFTIRQDGRVFANEDDPTEAENIYQMLKRTYPKSAIDLLENLVHPMVHTRVLKEYNPMFGETVVSSPSAVREPAQYAGGYVRQARGY